MLNRRGGEKEDKGRHHEFSEEHAAPDRSVLARDQKKSHEAAD